MHHGSQRRVGLSSAGFFLRILMHVGPTKVHRMSLHSALRIVAYGLGGS